MNRTSDRVASRVTGSPSMQPLEGRNYFVGFAFGAEQLSPAGSQPQGLATGDFDRDGKLDVAVTNYTDGIVGISFGQGDGTFEQGDAYDASGNLSGVAAGDVDGDGKIDLVATGNQVSVFLGDGDGTFEVGPVFDAGTSPQNSAIADINRDGKADIVTANIESSAVSVFLGNGDGTFQSQRTSGVGGGQSDVAIVDLNGDTIPDLALSLFGTLDAAGTGAGAAVLIGRGDGTFEPAKKFTTGKRPFAVSVGDFTGDGLPDIVTANGGVDIFPGTSSFSLLRNTGLGSFGTALNTSTGTRPGDIATADFDGDGKLDVVVADTGTSDVRAYQGNGDGTFKVPVPVNTDTGPIGLVAGDFDGNGLPDFAAACNGFFEGSISASLNQLDPVRVENGLLTVVGTDQADSIDVTVSAGNVRVARNGEPVQSFAVASVSRLLVRSGSGADNVTASTLAIPVYVDGGDGEDRINGGTAGDTLLGGAGNDKLWGNGADDKLAGGDGEDTLNGNGGKDTLDGGAGNDRLNGNGGNDRLFGQFGVDRLYGYDGNDILDGGSSGDRLDGGNGLDTLYGQSGDDRLFAHDNVAESIFGGSGNDSAQLDVEDLISSIEVPNAT